MAEYLFKNMTDGEYTITSAATSREEEGNPVHYGTRRILAGLKIPCDGFKAHTLTKAECDSADLIICMENANVLAVKRMCGRENFEKVCRLLDFTDEPGDIADPWYTHDFDLTYREIDKGLKALYKHLKGEKS